MQQLHTVCGVDEEEEEGKEEDEEEGEEEEEEESLTDDSWSLWSLVNNLTTVTKLWTVYVSMSTAWVCSCVCQKYKISNKTMNICVIGNCLFYFQTNRERKIENKKMCP